MNTQEHSIALPAGLPLTLLLAGLLIVLTSAPSAAEEATAELSADGLERIVESGVFYRWIDRNGQVQYTDFEPIGVPSEALSLDADEEAAEGISIDPVGQARPSDPFHDQDHQVLPIEHIGPCANARQQLAVLHGSQPVYRASDGSFRSAWRGDPYRGERAYLEDEGRQAAIQAARGEVLARCSDPEAFKAEVRAFRESIDGP